MRTITIASIIIFLFCNQTIAEENAPLNDDPMHDQGVELARKGKHREGLKLLQSILNKSPDNYEVQRDFIIIARWADNCDLALERYEQVQHRRNKEAYLLIPVAECLEEQNRPEQAIALLQTGLKDWPDDEELRNALQRFQAEKALRQAPRLSLSASSNNSDQGNREWSFSSRYEQRFLRDDMRIYGRYTTVRADDPLFETGDLNRVGLGLTYRFNHQWTLDYEFSTDTKESGQQGNTSILIYNPHYLWELSLEYASFAEDLPLRAKAINIESDRSVASANYHTRDYRWTWNLNASVYDFSDQNQRKSVYSALGYAFELEANREQRLILELYRGSNSLRENVVYYNPEDEISVALSHKTDFVYDTKYKRHVDHIIVTLGNYLQQNYPAKNTYRINLGQEYDFNDDHSLSYGLSYGSNIYDGTRENESSIEINYEYRF